jgi:hypothetical protein
MMRAPLFAACVITACSPWFVAAQAQVTVTGMVRDGAGRPLADVLVFLDTGAPQAVTDSLGVFRLEGVGVGVHAIHYRGTAYAPRSFNIALNETDALRDIGTVQLENGPPPTATLRGTVRETTGDQPVPDVEVEVNGRMVATTDSLGSFLVPNTAIQWGNNAITLRHRAFTETVESDRFWIGGPNEEVVFAIDLDIAPLALPGVAVEASRPDPAIPEKLKGFYERRRKGGATFWTEEEIVLRDAPNMTQLFRGIRFRGATTGRACTPVVLIDYRVSDLSAVTPEQLAAVEIYRSIGFMPIEFSHLGTFCGLIVLWTRS